MRLFSYIFLFLLTTWQLIAQTYPVQVVPVLTPPYSSKIADYANPMANKVQLQLITTDLSVQNRPVQLYVEIKGNGLTAASAPVLSGVSPLRISGGEILRLTNAELASYFQLRNLQGITSQQYAYASARNDATNLTIYSAGAILPLASGAYIRGGAKALNEEIMVVVAKKADNDEVELVYKNINDIAPNELYIATTIDNKQTQAFLDETKKQLDLYSINTQLDNLGKTGKQIEQLLSKEGKFIDNALEQDYQKYLARKSKESKSARDRLSWKKERDYWLNDSPMARGNEFNKKAWKENWYRYNEVTLENGKRLDSYTPPMNGVEGMIVSRKATNLEEIELSSFEDYLKEIKAKYPIGAKINAPKYGDELKGKVLEGKHYLEIPESNKSFGKLQEYIDLAKNKYDIEIIFKAE